MERTDRSTKWLGIVKRAIVPVLYLFLVVGLGVALSRVTAHHGVFWLLPRIIVLISFTSALARFVIWYLFPLLAWPVALLFAIGCKFRHPRAEYPCPYCGYDVRESLSRCPECGNVFSWGQKPS
jgi:hypothetical protein